MKNSMVSFGTSLLSGLVTLGVTLATTSLLLTGCDLAPKFKLPSFKVGNAYKESSPIDHSSKIDKPEDGNWTKATAPEQLAIPADWWTLFDDIHLMCLIEEANDKNPTIKAAKEHVEQARSQVRIASSAFFPAIDAGASPSRRLSSAASQKQFNPNPVVKPYTLYNAQGTISYDFDIFGQNRNNKAFESFKLASSQATLDAIRLTLQADIAHYYYTLRALTAEQAILKQSLTGKEQALELIQQKRDLGAVGDLDVSRYESDLALTKADAFAIQQQIEQTEHALAVLTGKLPNELSLMVEPLVDAPPVVPAGLPSELLQRRPDILAAQKDMAAANQHIGAVRASFFPHISLSALGGFESSELGDLFKWSSRTWLLGPLVGTTLSIPIFKGGEGLASLAMSKSSFRESVEIYRQKVLTAFQEVEDQLSANRSLTLQQEQLADALKASLTADSIAKQRYDSGGISYIERLDAEQVMLNTKRRSIQTLGQHYINTIQLIRALGGGWKPSQDEKKAE
ncbi:MAG: efflux transporter outer membrane subunit [Alphaproteobacteria bacterium]|nr:efflux transporter outer membrane subunit [Alphaproteobacteria bacterium]